MYGVYMYVLCIISIDVLSVQPIRLIPGPHRIKHGLFPVGCPSPPPRPTVDGRPCNLRIRGMYYYDVQKYLRRNYIRTRPSPTYFHTRTHAHENTLNQEDFSASLPRSVNRNKSWLVAADEFWVSISPPWCMQIKYEVRRGEGLSCLFFFWFVLCFLLCLVWTFICTYLIFYSGHFRFLF